MDLKEAPLSRRLTGTAGLDASARGAQKIVGVDEAWIFAGDPPDFFPDDELVRGAEGFHIQFI